MDAEEQDISLLDLLLVVAENIKLLILGPLAAGLLAWGVAYVAPQSYTSQVILALSAPTPQQAATLLVSPLVMDPVINAMGLKEGLTMEKARAKLGAQIKATVGKDNLLSLDVTAQSPQLAQKLATALVDSLLKSTIPGSREREDLQRRLTYAKSSLDAMQRLLTGLENGQQQVLDQMKAQGGIGISMVGLSELQARYVNEVIGLERALEGLSSDVVKQAATLPTEPVAPKKGLVAVIAGLAAGLALLLWVFLRSAWRVAAQDPQTAAKQTRLRAALWLDR